MKMICSLFLFLVVFKSEQEQVLYLPQLSIVFLPSLKDLTEAHLRCTRAFISGLCY